MGLFGKNEVIKANELFEEEYLFVMKICSTLEKNKVMSKDLYLSFKFPTGNGINVKVLPGVFSTEHGLPVIENVIVQDLESQQMVVAKLGFIDTGATNTIISNRLVEELKIPEERILRKKRHVSALGEQEVSYINSISLHSKDIDLTSGSIVIVGDLGEYDIALGNDALRKCQFHYEGLTQTYVLRSFSI